MLLVRRQGCLRKIGLFDALLPHNDLGMNELKAGYVINKAL